MSNKRSRKANSPAAYGDVKFVMDLAVDQPGLTYECATPGRAIYFRQRCQIYRNLIREMQEELLDNVPGVRAQSAYDPIVIRQVDEDGTPNATNSKVDPPRAGGRFLRFDHEALDGVLRAPDGSRIEVPDSFHLLDDSK